MSVIEFEFVQSDKPNPWRDDNAQGYSWLVTLRANGKSQTFDFWTGELAGSPELGDVLNCLVQDALAYDDPAELDDLLSDLSYSQAKATEAAMKENRHKFYDLADSEAEWEAWLAFDWESVPEGAESVEVQW